MNTTATYSSDHSWSRRCSTETVFSIQGKETDYARDTSDTDGVAAASDSDVEYEPVTESDDEDGAAVDLDGDSSAQSDNNIISTKVLEVSVGDDGELQFADSEETETYESDSEMDLYDYWHCAQCRAKNNNPLYRYCQKCFQVRKSFFPPRPRPKRNKEPKLSTDLKTKDEIPRTMSQDSGVDSLNSQETHEDPGEGTSNCRMGRPERNTLSSPRPKRKKIEPKLTDSVTETDEIPRTMSQDSGVDSLNSQEVQDCPGASSEDERPVSRCKKRRADFPEQKAKRKRHSRTDTGSDSSDNSQSTEIIRPLTKTVSDPAITIEDLDVKITKKVIANTLIEKLEPKDLCVICVAEPKSGAFVHGRIAHICCCYKCAVKVWATVKRCPVCNCKVSNVLRAIVM